jgi:lysophospholipase L1-like esterase
VKGYRTVLCAFVVGGLSVALLLLPLLHKRITARAIAKDFGDVVQYVEYRFDENKSAIDCWGDSLTEGKSLTPGHDFPHLVSYVFHRKVINQGVGGETSTQIKKRMISRPIPPFPENAVIWAGRNDDLGDIEVIEKNIDDMVSSLHPRSHFLILGVINSDTARERRGGDRYRAILKLNDDLHARYGKNFLPIRDLLIAQANRNDPEDDEAVEADIVPPSLRLDALHLNDQGEALVAYAVESAITANGW